MTTESELVSGAKRLAAGALAGAAATIPMSWAMELMHQLLPRHERAPLPPREITDRLAEAARLDDRLSNAQGMWLALAGHLGYGAAVGSLYGSLLRRLPFHPLAKGTAYGLAVWAGSYLGLMPALGLLSPATRHPPGRTTLMILAHVVWGSAVGIFTDLMETDGKRRHPEFLGAQESRHQPQETPEAERIRTPVIAV